MIIQTSELISTSTSVSKCPKADLPEYAFIGRSNVGKSSLINSITNHKKLAHVSGTPGKTKVINHFLINKSWYLVDLPGYGYAKISEKKRVELAKIISNYVSHRENLVCMFVLLDSRLEPQKADLGFMQFLAENKVPFVMVFTKIDKLSSNQINKNIENYKKIMLNDWQSLPQMFKTSAEKHIGRDDILHFIEETNKNSLIVK